MPKLSMLPGDTLVSVAVSARKMRYLAALVRRQLLILDAKNDAAIDLTDNLLEMQRQLKRDQLILLLESLTNANVFVSTSVSE